MSTLDDRAKELLARPSLEGLSYLLTHREHWPAGFTWAYDNCDHCAMGLANQLWFHLDADHLMTDAPRRWLAKGIGIPVYHAEQIFLNLGGSRFDPGYVERTHAVTPEHVASAIDAYLESRR